VKRRIRIKARAGMNLSPAPCHAADLSCTPKGGVAPSTVGVAALGAQVSTIGATPTNVKAKGSPQASNAFATPAARSSFFRAQVKAIVISGIILLITLTWNSTFEKLFERFIGDRDRFIAQLIYAFLITGILFLVLYFFTRKSDIFGPASAADLPAPGGFEASAGVTTGDTM